jgi:hypothetical protein
MPNRRRKATSERNFGMSYIIKNCPATGAGCCGDTCPEITDCPLKQIIQVCNEYSDKWEDCDFSNGLSDKIFKLLDIQEVE